MFSSHFAKTYSPPPPLLRNIERVIESDEILVAGSVISRTDELAHLPNGTYVFCIDSQKRIIYSPRTPLEVKADELRHTVTHRSLFARLKEIYATDPQIVAAGEFKITNGRVSFVSNRAGTFKGGSKHLKFSISALKKSGLPIEKKTQFRDLSKTPGDESHMMAREISKFEAKYRGTQSYAAFAFIYQRLAEAYPDPNTPGYFDENKIRVIIEQERSRLMSLLENEKEPPSPELFKVLKWADYTVEWIQKECVGLAASKFVEPSPSMPSLKSVIAEVDRLFFPIQLSH